MGSVAESIASSRVKAAIPASGFWGIRIARSSSVINIVTNLSVITHVFSIVLKKRLKGGARSLGASVCHCNGWLWVYGKFQGLDIKVADRYYGATRHHVPSLC